MKDSNKNYRRHEKPPYSYITLIAMAIKAQKDDQATLQQINDWLIHNFIFFRGEYIGWKNSVRHNLSLNDCFIKILRDPSRPWGKDNYWRIAENCNYIFKDGVFRRRKKKTAKERKQKISFSIDYILSLPEKISDDNSSSTSLSRSSSPTYNVETRNYNVDYSSYANAYAMMTMLNHQRLISL